MGVRSITVEWFHGPSESEVSDTVIKLGKDVALFQQSLIASRIRLQEMIAAVDHDSLNAEELTVTLTCHCFVFKKSFEDSVAMHRQFWF